MTLEARARLVVGGEVVGERDGRIASIWTDALPKLCAASLEWHLGARERAAWRH